ncbi:ATP-binding protein [Patescibacteria group bacterium]|nr:ATP-binding protein [Candidatus Falkowbacteria bacterium]MBU4014785.1 ATP-binding protein [Patescibacteria group bacterium]MBU4072744.1 ATP-binding protein [Patescibacteria group bacterium]MBU4124871.1 ATP-binding protein [Patescibacteria group bacterium]
MIKPTKPIFYNGFKIKDGLTIKNRVERIFFTEVYLLSNDKYLYIFTNIKPEEIVDRGKKYNLITIHFDSKNYLGVIIEEHSHEKITAIIDDLTILRGFDCVAGMEELKVLLINDVIDPLLNPEKFKKFKLSIPNGILLYGPPGCGKTFIVKKLAEELNYNLVELSPSSVATSYVHGAVGNIGKVFEMAKLQAPSIVFIDEIEGLIPKREELSSSADIKKEEINEFLLQLNNAGENKVLVVGATNRPHMIDSAILRAGRMDKRIYIPAPDFEARKGMFKICLSGRPHNKNINFEKLAEMTDNYVSSDIELIVTQAARMAVAKNKNMVDEKMLIESINKFSPSISPEEIQYYEQFGNMERW